METVNLNKNWIFCKLDSQGNPIFSKKIDIPHDAMIFEKRSEDAPGGLNVSFFEGGDYIYSRDIEISNDDLNKNLYLEFEGIYHNGEIYLNDKLVYKRPYGYADFFVDITSFVHVGINKLKVKVINSDQPNSRWYSGSGIYRPVSLIKIDNENSILLNGVKIKTTSINPVTCSINVKTIGNGTITVSIFDEDKRIAIKSKKATGDDTLEINLDNKKIILWDEDYPKLYRIKVEFNNDSQVFDYGFRLIKYNENGLFLNGKRLLIKGACIHHDNGPLGAIDDDFANRRKIKLLKDVGYNALRSAHNPISKSLIKACDELGMMILDELVDCWIIHKTLYDYVNIFDEWHEIDLLDMVNKDYNHPSVIMYSTGNEVGETSMKRGIELTKEMTDYLHALDDTRPVTCGINIFFNFLASMGFGVYSDKKAEKYSSKQGEKKRKKVGSEFFNAIAGKLGASFMKTMATLVFCDYKTKDAFKNMDIAGYNYGIKRYKHDLRKYKSRLILGSETFCNDAYKFMELAKDNPRVAEFCAECAKGGVSEADLATKEKEGVPTGFYVKHPLTGKDVEVWVGNYVLMSYGEGAVMGVPAHDERDFAFAKKYGLEIRQVVSVPGKTYSTEAWQDWYADKSDNTKLVNSGEFDGLNVHDGIDKIAEALATKGLGEKKTQFRIRD